ncbi:MAG TPA: ABC transporter permease [Chlorobaculum sp.]|uniref:ABC-type export system, membrane protein n=1 Tax=Chlorobaculum tepidum (strain ATCC 49652 / DSM 12025 / NBRC 103806 / TLS) TaxID=194439 RepID=Q8KEY1_CHLTE|nr:ABC-type export system, membrane protein [Chlorobaculum tepidum TLS]HBU24031.1 ABC transporter permease [Chlorobaculum sp.]
MNVMKPVSGIYRVALKLLMNDKSKFTALLVGITFAVFLMVMMMSMFSGILARSCAPVYNIGAKIWVMDPAVNNTNSSIPMPDYILSASRSIPGVKYAVPLYFGSALVKLKDGTYQAATVVGLDDATLFGRPEMLEGRIEDVFAENAFVVVKDAEYAKLESPKIGTQFEINDNRGTVVGLAKVASSGLFGIPTLYTTYNRAITYIPSARFTISYVLIEPKSEADVPGIQKAIAKLGYEALTREQFVQKVSNFYTFKTGVGINILMMTGISFVVGLSISGQTFYTFILENIGKFGAMKAIGAKGNELVSMILVQAVVTSLIGYGLGVGAASTFMIVAKLRMPDYAAQLTYQTLGLALVMVMIIAAVSSYIGVRKVLQIQPFDIFRG